MTQRNVLKFSALVELGTGIALLAAPGEAVVLLIGGALAGAGIAATRCFGIALLALALACLPDRSDAADVRPVRAMLAYNALVALYLGYLGIVGHASGMLLWPAVALHAAVAAALAVARRDGRADVTT